MVPFAFPPLLWDRTGAPRTSSSRRTEGSALISSRLVECQSAGRYSVVQTFLNFLSRPLNN